MLISFHVQNIIILMMQWFVGKLIWWTENKKDDVTISITCGWSILLFHHFAAISETTTILSSQFLSYLIGIFCLILFYIVFAYVSIIAFANFQFAQSIADIYVYVQCLSKHTCQETKLLYKYISTLPRHTYRKTRLDTLLT